ncbi:penicillin-binding protein activator [Sessilibacter sp. MAH1]
MRSKPSSFNNEAKTEEFIAGSFNNLRASIRVPTQTLKISLLAVSLCGVLVGCGGNEKPQNQSLNPSQNTSESIQSLLDKAQFAEQQGAQDQAQAFKLAAAKALYNQLNIDASFRLYDEIRPEFLDENNFVDYSISYGELALNKGEYFIANRLFNSNRLNLLITTLEPDLELKLRQHRALLYALLDESIKAIHEHLAITPLLTTPEQEQENSEKLWAVLTALPESSLVELSTSESSSLLKGWYALAAISKNNDLSLDQQLQQVNGWRLQWRDHPANRSLPQDLQLLQQLVVNQPKQVALLLPLSGRYASAASAIRDGFLATYFDSLNKSDSAIQIKIYDTEGANINTVYDQAVAEGAGAIIGPLQKESLEELNLRPVLPVPTLALNYLNDQQLLTENLFQFGLSAEDEGYQIAERAWLDGKRRVMILASNRDWGQRAAEAFKAHWLELGGEVAADTQFAEQQQFSNIIETSLLVDRSKQRMKDLRRVIGKNIEFEPRSRDDIDMIFMVANNRDAKQLKPTLAFHYAGDVPVYATSHLYNGFDSAGANGDLNGIRFISLPWYFGYDPELKDQLERNLKTPESLQSLHALGVDAFRLYPRLKQLETIDSTKLYGATGSLQLDNMGKMKRVQTWATIINGQAKVLPSVANGLVLGSR